MSRLNYKHFALLAAVLATLFLLGGCLADKEKAAAKQQEKLVREVAAIQDELILTADAPLAISKLEKLNEKHPDQLVVIEALGVAHREKGDPLMAAFYYDYAFELAPERSEFALQAAHAHEKNGSAAEALTAYRAYLALEPAASGLWHNIALLEMGEENYQLALSAYLEALGTDKIEPDAQDKLNIAILYHRLGNQPQAQRWYESLLAERKLEQPLRVTGMTGLFDLALRQKQWDRALELMHDIDRLSPGALQEGAYASAYAELVQWDKARKEAEAAALAQAEKERAALMQKAEVQTENETAVQAQASGEPAVQAQTELVKQTQKESSAEDSAQTTKEPAQSEAVVKAAAEDAMDSKSGAIENRAQVSANAEVVDVVDTELAEKTSTETAAAQQVAEGTDPAKPEAVQADPAKSATAQAATAEAKAAPTEAVEARAASTEPTIAGKTLTGQSAATSAADVAATADAAEAAAQEASAAELALRGQEAFMAKDYAQAAQLLEQSAKLNPNNGEVLDMLSRASFRTGLYPQAERYAMLATYAEPKNVNYRLEYLRAYQRNHPPASMLQQLISAKETFPSDPNVTLALARGYEYLAQRKAQAAALYREYLQLAPQSELAEDIQQKLLEWEM